MAVTVHLVLFGGLTAAVLALRRALEWLLLRDHRAHRTDEPRDSSDRRAA
jgi:hypothetical protein